MSKQQQKDIHRRYVRNEKIRTSTIATKGKKEKQS